MVLLSFDSVTFGYDSRPILQEVNFALQPGRIAAILGPNGAGKSTLLALALGWLVAWRGEIRLGDTPLRALSLRERGQRIAFVPQTEHTPFEYTVLDYVLMGRAPHVPPLGAPSPADVRMAFQALEEVGLASLAWRSIPQLSGGERQLMLIARALTQLSPMAYDSPSASRLLLLDEPTSHLDLRNKVRIIEVLRRLRQAGVAILMTSHEPDVVLAVADDVLLLEGGGFARFGSLEEVFTAEALSRVYGLPIRLVQLDQGKHVLWT